MVDGAQLVDILNERVLQRPVRSGHVHRVLSPRPGAAPARSGGSSAASAAECDDVHSSRSPLVSQLDDILTSCLRLPSVLRAASTSPSRIVCDPAKCQ